MGIAYPAGVAFVRDGGIGHSANTAPGILAEVFIFAA